jgi:hypothetical protein
VPAKSKAQLKLLYHEAGEGKAWAKKWLKETPDAEKSRLMKQKDQKKKKKAKKVKKHSKRKANHG